MASYGKRPPVKKRGFQIPEPIKGVAKDIASGIGELKRQSGAAVENVKEGIRKIKRSLSR